MNKVKYVRPVDASAATAGQTPAPGGLAPPASAQHISDPRETAQEAVHEITLKDEVKAPDSPRLDGAAPKAPLRAAKGDDDLMSKQPQQAMPSVDGIKGKWKQQVGAAKVAWGKLTEDELLKSEGHSQKLAGLVQERYAITRDEADRQIKKFFDAQAS